MAQLVPGVVKQGVPAAAPQRAPSPPPRPGPSPSAPDTPPSAPLDRAALAAAEAERDALRTERDALLVERDALLVERDALLVEREALRAELAESREALDAVASVPPEGEAVGALLQARGLRGRDELLRGLEALLSARQGGRLLDARLDAAAAQELRREIAQLMLLDGPRPRELAVPAVAVSGDRAEAPGAPTLDRHLHDLSEHMLLSGWRRLVLVGVPPRWHEAIEHRLDRRVEVAFRPAGPWSPEQVASVDADLVGAVGLQADEEALVASPATWVLEADLIELLRRLVQVARGDES